MNRTNVDILEIPEVRWTWAGSYESDGYTMVYSEGKKHEKGVGISVNQASSGSLMG